VAQTPAHALTERLDNIALHPIAGPWILLALLFLLFQAVFAWAKYPMDAIQAGADALGKALAHIIPAGYVQSFLVDGVIAGAGGVLVFLPQILILFFFILVLEESGYLPRAAFILDRLMGSVGLSGRSFIPLLSSYACAIPGIMATRTISDPRDRLVTILIAPLTTCSARLPVYALLIAAFIPRRQVAGLFELQGLVLFVLYLAGIIGAMAVAYFLKIFTKGGGKTRSLMMELPDYHWPTLRNVALGLWQRAWIFVRRVGGIILLLTIALWLLSSFPAPPAGATAPAIEYSLAGTLGRYLSYVFAPIGFNWQISIALVPGIAAREVMVGALGTVYALSGTGDDAAKQLAPVIAQQWSLATGLSLLAWYVFAPQCLSTLAAVKRETGGWRIPAMQVAYMFVLAYAASYATYHIALYFSA
jgi:ferrous iron transport protein B